MQDGAAVADLSVRLNAMIEFAHCGIGCGPRRIDYDAAN